MNQISSISIGSGAAFLTRVSLMKTNSISFKASYIQPGYIPIKTLDQKKEPKTIEGAFVELSPYSENDLDTMCDLNEHWGFLETYAFQIYDSMERINNKLLNYSENSKFYALTLQEDSFEKLDPKKILGITEVVEHDDKITINFLQVDPENKRNAPLAKYLHIGSRVIDSIKNIYEKTVIDLKSTKSARKFYTAVGFVKKSQNSNDYIYIPKNGKH